MRSGSGNVGLAGSFSGGGRSALWAALARKASRERERGRVGEGERDMAWLRERFTWSEQLGAGLSWGCRVLSTKY
jgi:hypothetical protein